MKTNWAEAVAALRAEADALDGKGYHATELANGYRRAATYLERLAGNYGANPAKACPRCLTSGPCRCKLPRNETNPKRNGHN